jgi:hypothetical protein
MCSALLTLVLVYPLWQLPQVAFAGWFPLGGLPWHEVQESAPGAAHVIVAVAPFLNAPWQ